MPPRDALHIRTELTEQFGDRRFWRIMEAHVELDQSLNSHRDRAAWGPDRMQLALQAAETYYVSPEMSELAQAAVETFPLDETILHEDQPSAAGFMYLPARFRFLELRGRLQVVHAVLWMNNRVWCLTDRNDPDDEISAMMREEGIGSPTEMGGRWDLNGMQGFSYGQPLPQLFSFPKSVLPPGAKVQISREEGSVRLFTDHAVEIQDAVATVQADPVLRYLLVLWRLMQQTLAEVHREDEHPRPLRRRAERAHVPTAVTVISLRRRASTSIGTGESINYRTIVRAHWRKVWCGPAEDRYQRSVLVHGYWRGPEGAPIIIRNRIQALIR